MTRTHVRALVAVASILALATSNAHASTLIDLTAPGANNLEANNVAALGGSFVVQQTSDPTSGGGVVESFVRLQSREASEQGYNTDARPLQFDEKNSPRVTHSLLLSDVPTVNLTVNGVTEPYRQFVLDINQNNKQPLLSLNQVQIFLRDAGNLNDATVQFPATSTTPPVIAFVDPFSTEVFRLNNNVSSFFEIQLKDAKKSDPNQGDMFLYVRDAAFQSALSVNPDQQFVYLYSQFGTPPGANANNGRFEQWGILKAPPVPIPEPSTVALAMTGLATLGVAGLCRRGRPLLQASA